MKDPQRVSSQEEVAAVLLLWAHVLARGVRDFTGAERKRAELEALVDSPEGEGFRKQLESFQRIAAERRELLAQPVPRAYKEAKLRAKQIQDKSRLLSSSLYDDVVVFLGLDEPTAWFWSDSPQPGSLSAIYSLFPGFPKLSEFRRFIVSNALRQKKFKWGGIDLEGADEE